MASVLERDADRPALLEAENTFNWHSGSVYSLEALRGLRVAAKRRGVLALAFGGPGAIRAITHLDVDDAGIERAAVAFREAAAETWGRTA